MSKHTTKLAYLLVLGLAACPGGGGGTSDAAANPDSAATADAPAPTADAPVPTADAPAPMPDASAPAVDAAPPAVDAGGPSSADGAPITSDAGLSDIPMVCDTICAKIFSCFMMPPDPGCSMGCQADLGDCTPAQLDEVNACNAVDCSADPNVVVTCLMAVTCINMGP